MWFIGEVDFWDFEVGDVFMNDGVLIIVIDEYVM